MAKRRRRRSSRQRIDGGQREEEEGLGWVGLTDPDPSRAVKPSLVGWLGRQACWASRPDGPVWFCQLFQKQKFKFKFKGYFLLEFKPNSKIQTTPIKHFPIL
jgi:hypothetical protein